MSKWEVVEYKKKTQEGREAMTWRSCADDPPERSKWVLVRYSVLPHAQAYAKTYEMGCWIPGQRKGQRRWLNNQGFELRLRFGFDNAEWTEIPE